LIPGRVYQVIPGVGRKQAIRLYIGCFDKITKIGKVGAYSKGKGGDYE